MRTHRLQNEHAANSCRHMAPFFYFYQTVFRVKVQHLKLSLWWSNNNDHPLFGIHPFRWGNLKKGRQPALTNSNLTLTHYH